PTLRQAAIARHICEQEMRQALANSSFELFLQPKVRLTDKRIIGAEALLRWHHPERGLVAPNAFLSVLERSTLALDVGQWVLETACGQAAQIRQCGFRSFKIAVNLFGLQFRRSDLVATILRMLEENKLDSDAIEIEITENIIRQHDDDIIKPII